MSLEFVVLSGDLADGSGSPVSGSLTFWPTAWLTDTTSTVIPPSPVTVPLSPTGTFVVALLATDNTEPPPNTWLWNVKACIAGTAPYLFSFALLHADGAEQDFATIVPVPPTDVTSGYIAGGDLSGTYPDPTVTATHLSAPLPVGQGGTGQATQQSALDALSGTQSPGTYLRSSGTHVTLSAIQGADLPAATGSVPGAIELTGDLGGTATSPQVTGTHLSAPLPLAQGGTGAATQQAALNALTGAQTAGDYVRSNGTNAGLSAIQAADLPSATSSAKGALELTGDLGGTATSPTVVSAHLASALPVAQGGTGQATQAAALTALAGTQASGEYLRSNGTATALSAILAADLPAATGSSQGALELTGDLGGTATSPQVVASHLATPLPIAQGGTGASAQNFASLLSMTPVKTAGYSASPGDYVRADATSGSLVVTLPAAPANLAAVGAKMTGTASTNTVTVQCQGGDVLNKSGGGTAYVLSLVNQGAVFQYSSAGAIWLVVADNLSLGQLDARYAPLNVVDGVTVSGTPASGQVLTATSGTAADWQTPSGGGGGISPPAGDIGGTSGSPTVVSTHLSAALPVAQGGTGDTSLTAYGLLAAGTTSTGALQQVSGTGSSSQVLTSNGASALPTWQAGGLSNPMTTLGDGIYGGASGVPTRMPGNTTAQTMAMVQTGTGSVSAAPGWAVVSGQFLAMSQYAPGTQTLLTASSTSFTQLSSSVNTGSFVAPPSGMVMVNVSFVSQLSATGQFGIGLAPHGTTTMVAEQISRANAATVPLPYMANFMVTGLTAGTSYNFDLMGCGGSNTLTVMAQGQTTASPSLATSNEAGPVILSVQAI